MIRNLAIIILIAGFITTLSCKGDEKDFLLLGALASNVQNSAPNGVNPEDIKAVENQNLTGGGVFQEITGSSQSTEPQAGTAPATGDDSASGNNDNQNSGNEGASGSNDDQKSGDGSASGSNDDHKSGDGSASAGNDDHKSGDGSASAGNDDHKSGDDDSDGKKNLVRLGKDICYAQDNSNWYKDNSLVFTYNDNRAAGFCFENVEAGTYEVRVMASHWVNNKGKKSDGALPSTFHEYYVMVGSDGSTNNMVIPATDNGWKDGTATLKFNGGPAMVMVAWTNGAANTNFAIHQVKLKKISDGSALAGSIRGIPTQYLTYMLIFLIAAVGGIVAMRVMKTKNS